MIQAIETRYKGYRFRSRLEARWAVYFDAMNIEWRYEHDGYDLPTGYYLPDFWFPEANAYGEVKAVHFSQDETQRDIELVRLTGRPCAMLAGQPDFGDYALLVATEKEVTELWGYKFGPFYCGLDVFPIDIDFIEEWWCDEKILGFHGYRFPINEAKDEQYKRAIYAARAARFEHGERP